MLAKKILFIVSVLVIGVGYTQENPKPVQTIYLFFNNATDSHFSLNKNLDTFEIATEDGETYTFICNDSVQRESSIANIKFTNRMALKSLLNNSLDRHYIIVKRTNSKFLFFHSRLQL